MGAINSAFALISSSMSNNEFADAVLYASTLWEIINHKHDNKIPEDQRQPFIARGAHFLSLATLRLAMNGGIPPEGKQKAGQEAIALARRALEIHTQLYGTEDDEVANDMCILAEALIYFNDDDDDDDDEEILRLLEQAKANYAQVFGSSSVNVAVSECKLGHAFLKRANGARIANDLDRCKANLELSLRHFREAARIYRVLNRVDEADRTARMAMFVEEQLQQLVTASAAEAAATRG